MSDSVDISGINKDLLLEKLWKAAKPGPVFAGPSEFNLEQAKSESSTYGRYDFDYVLGRSFKVDLGYDTVNPWLYDRDNGSGKFQSVVDEIRTIKP